MRFPFVPNQKMLDSNDFTQTPSHCLLNILNTPTSKGKKSANLIETFLNNINAVKEERMPENSFPPRNAHTIYIRKWRSWKRRNRTVHSQGQYFSKKIKTWNKQTTVGRRYNSQVTIMSPAANKTAKSNTSTTIWRQYFPLNNHYPQNQASSDIYAKEIVCVFTLQKCCTLSLGTVLRWQQKVLPQIVVSRARPDHMCHQNVCSLRLLHIIQCPPFFLFDILVKVKVGHARPEHIQLYICVTKCLLLCSCKSIDRRVQAVVGKASTENASLH